ncbi:MAG: S41 family peptidase [Cyclobacteriaceae bacterium]
MNNKLRFELKHIIALLLVVMAFSAYTSQKEKSFAISRNIDIFASLFKEVNTYYIEDIDPDQLAETGINAMLESLDPYTNYIPAEKMDRYSKLTTGEYFGIGAKIEEIDGKKLITMPLEGYSAHKNGLRIGDEIIAINGKYVTNKSIEYVNQLLQNRDDLVINLTIQKNGSAKVEELSLEKDIIKIKNVPFYGKINNSTGYIKLSEFTFGASDEVKEALLQLKKDGIEQLVLDLRDNPGGLLNEAIDVSNIFIERGKEIVRTEGKIIEWNKSYKSLNEPVDLYLPMVVLVNENSASAAEIVAGVLQDYDRAVLVGEKTFGKGLVQATRTLSHNAKLKITTAKYYIPSGRCIQSIDYNWDQNASHNKSYSTINGRKVLDGQGIAPDVVISNSGQSELFKALASKGLVFEYANWYSYRKSAPKKLADFQLTDEEYSHFISWLDNKNFDYQSELEQSLIQFEKKIKSVGAEELNASIASMKLEIEKLKANELQKYARELKNKLEEEIAARYYLEKGFYELAVKHDQDVMQAVRVLQNNTAYNSILGISTRL